MSSFAYKGFDAAGQVVRGRREAGTVSELRDALISDRVTPVSITQRASVRSRDGGRLALSEAAAGAFAADLARFLRSGLSIGQALQILATTAEHGNAAALAERARADLIEGTPLSGALAVVRGQTGRFLQALAKAGEATGRLPDILDGGASALRASAALKRRLLTLCVYPAFVLAMAIGAISVFAFAVLPALEPAFAGLSVELPIGTRMMLAGGRVLRAAMPFLLAGAAALAATVAVSPPVRHMGRSVGARLLLTPLGGGMLQDAVFASLSRRLGIAIGAGLPVLTAFRVCVDAVGVDPIRLALQAQEERMREGAKLSEVLRASGYAPRLLISLSKVGETSTDLPQVLDDAGKTLGARAEEKMERTLALLTPAIVMAIGVVVGGVVLMVFQGLLSISEAVDT